MKNIVVTGADGFIGKNLLAHLRFMNGLSVQSVVKADGPTARKEKLHNADVVFHLAGVNRPTDPSDFDAVNTALTEELIDALEAAGRPYIFVFASSTQAILDNPYGKSKLAAEEVLARKLKHGQLIIYRLAGVFGKWCKPNYNSVVATFCYNVANNIPLEIRDPGFMLNLVYIDDVVSGFAGQLELVAEAGKTSYQNIEQVYTITLGDLASSIRSFRDNRVSLFIPMVGDSLQKALYSTYLTYLPLNEFSYPLQMRSDNRGTLYELLKSPQAGQLFVSTTLPGITRGNHFHHTKTEKFLVIQGTGLIQFRSVNGSDIIEYRVSGEKPEMVDIPPGYTHNITNTGTDTMITLFWANEVFNPERPDTFFVPV